MIIAFQNRDIRTLCENDSEAVAVFGDAKAKVLQDRLADLRAARFMSELPLSPSGIRGDNTKRQFVLEVSEEMNLAFEVNHKNAPFLDNGEIDRSRVRRIKILDIEER